MKQTITVKTEAGKAIYEITDDDPQEPKTIRIQVGTMNIVVSIVPEDAANLDRVGG